MHTIAAKAVCFGEALKPEFKEYGKRIVANAKAFEEGLREAGFDMVSGGTDNHLILIDLRSKGITGKDFEKRLDEVGITVNKNAIPDDPQSPFVTSGVRVGTPAATTRGLEEDDFREIARLMGLVAASDFEENIESIREGVKAICAKYPLYN
jgi:glycine hydroxymethyltransferase